MSTDRHRSVVQYAADSPCTHIWIEAGLESGHLISEFSETSAVILSSCMGSLQQISSIMETLDGHTIHNMPSFPFTGYYQGMLPPDVSRSSAGAEPPSNLRLGVKVRFCSKLVQSLCQTSQTTRKQRYKQRIFTIREHFFFSSNNSSGFKDQKEETGVFLTRGTMNRKSQAARQKQCSAEGLGMCQSMARRRESPLKHTGPRQHHGGYAKVGSICSRSNTIQTVDERAARECRTSVATDTNKPRLIQYHHKPPRVQPRFTVGTGVYSVPEVSFLMHTTGRDAAHGHVRKTICGRLPADLHHRKLGKDNLGTGRQG